MCQNPSQIILWLLEEKSYARQKFYSFSAQYLTTQRIELHIPKIGRQSKTAALKKNCLSLILWFCFSKRLPRYIIWNIYFHLGMGVGGWGGETSGQIAKYVLRCSYTSSAPFVFVLHVHVRGWVCVVMSSMFSHFSESLVSCRGPHISWIYANRRPSNSV